MKSKNPRGLLRPLLAFLAISQTLSATRLAYEGFEYTEADGTSVNGLNGGTGWDAAFPAPNGSITLQPGLSFSGLNTVGKSMRWTPNANTRQGRNWDVNSSAVPADGTYWFSVVVNSSGSSQGNFNWMYSTKATNGQNGVGFRTSNDGSGGLNFKPLNPNVDGAGETQAGTGTAGTPTLIVGRLNLVGGSDSSFRIWVNPSTDPSVVPQDGDANSSVTTVSAADTATLRPSIAGRCFGTNTGAGPNYMEYDEIRIGNTFAEVLPPQAGAPEFGLDPLSAVANQTLTFTWTSLPAASNPTLNGSSVSIDANGAGSTTLPAPAADTTYTLAWAGGSLTQDFVAISPSFSLSQNEGFLGDTITVNWQVPVGSTAVILNPGAINVTGLTSGTNGTGTTSFTAPTATTTYELTWTGAASPLSQTFTLNPSQLVATPSSAIADVTEVTFSYRIPPAWDENPTGNTVTIQSSTNSGPFMDLDFVEFSTDPDTGAGTYVHTPAAGETQYRLAYFLNDVAQFLTVEVPVFPAVLSNFAVTGSNIVDPNATQFPKLSLVPMDDGVLAYTDRGHVWAEIPSILQGAHFVQTANGDKEAANLQISMTALVDSTFFLYLDNRIGDNVGGNDPASGTNNPPTLGNGVMNWVLTSGFVDSGVDIGLDESPVSGTTTIDQSYSVFFRQVNQGDSFTFFAQNNGGFRNMYGVAAVAPQVTPVALAVNPDAIINGGSALLQWTVPTGFTSVTLNPGAINVTSNTATGTGVGSLTVNPASDTTYTLSYNLGGGNVALPPVSVAVNSFTATPATIDAGESTTLNWDVPAGATAVTINAGVGNVTALTNANGVGSTTASPGATTTYTLSYIAQGETTVTNTGAITVTVIPVAPSAPLILSAESFSGGSLTVSWPAPNGVTNPANLTDVIERSTTLLPDSWTTIPSTGATITDGVVRFTDGNPPAGGKAFYRITRP